MGCIGLSRREFLALTPDEFNAIYEQWNAWETVRFRTEWEQARFMAHCGLMPHTKKRLAPTDLIRFDWDKEQANTLPAATKEDFERIVRKFDN